MLRDRGVASRNMHGEAQREVKGGGERLALLRKEVSRREGSTLDEKFRYRVLREFSIAV